jgi:hypothetical protein
MESKFIFSADRSTFVQLKPDVHFDLAMPYPKPTNSHLWDKNSLLVPMKKFNDILKE